MNLSRASTLVLPDLSGVPRSYSRVAAEDTSLDLATSFIQAGLGSMELWARSDRNVPTFLKLSLNAWLQSLGAAEVNEFSDFCVRIDDRVGRFETPQGKLLVSIDTDTYMAIQIGALLDALENHAKGLGRACFEMLIDGVSAWIRPYDYRDTEGYLDYWAESIRSELRNNEDFDAGCKRLGVDFLYVEKDTPAYLKGSIEKWPERKKAYLALLNSHSRGKFGSVISDVLEIVSLPPQLGITQEQWDEMEFEWEAAPLPALLVNFRQHDAIEQCFDAEFENVHETWPEPEHIMLMEYASVDSVKAMMEELGRFMRVLRAIGRISEAASKSKEKANERDHQRRRAGELLAA